METWVLKQRHFWPEDLSINFNLPLSLSQILSRRKLKTYDDIRRYLSRDKSSCHDPFLMKDMDKSIDIIREKIQNNKKVLISLDYDVDGIISGAIAYLGFRKLGLNCECIFPHRVTDGYGLNERIVQYAVTNNFSTIITFDNGISSFDPIHTAMGSGIEVIVTDHHKVPQIEQGGIFKDHLVPATSIINPHQKECSYPYKKICGAMISYKFLLALNNKMGFSEKNISDLYPLVSIATICDVMDLQDENRICVHHGLREMKDSVNIGLRTIMNLLEIHDNPSVYDIGFRIGPCFNSAGRLSSAEKAFELLISNDLDHANKIAAELIALNNERKQMTLDATLLAIEEVEKKELYKKNNIIILLLKDIHESLAGIVAGRLKDQYNIPCIIFSDSEGIYKGSARSTDQINIFEVISLFKNYLLKFGGHSTAAGLSIEPIYFNKFVNSIMSHMNELSISRENIYYVDAIIPFSIIDIDFVKSLEIFEPFGKGNPELLFSSTKVRLKKIEWIGKNQNVLKIHIISDGLIRPFVSFSYEKILKIIKNKLNLFHEHDIIELLPNNLSEVEFDIIYKLGIRKYKGTEYLNLELISIR